MESQAIILQSWRKKKLCAMLRTTNTFSSLTKVSQHLYDGKGEGRNESDGFFFITQKKSTSLELEID